MLFIGPRYYIYIFISIGVKVGWFLFWKKMMNGRDMVKLYSICLFASFIAALLELLFLIQVLSFEFKIVLFIVSYGTVLGKMYAVGLFGGPISGALIDEAAERSGIINQSEAVSDISGTYSGNLWKMPRRCE